MRISLIDVDSKMPNLTLMKISTYHKSLGDEVKLGYDPLMDKPDLCYASKIFDFTPEPEYMPDCPTIKGGPGYSLTARVPIENYDRIMPDYSLYPESCYAVGRFTRGCPNRCPWCVVWRMDGNEVRHVADLTDFWQGQKVVRILDDNIMADEDEFVADCKQLRDAGVKVIWEALDVRRVNDRTAEALSTVKQAKSIHFSWDGKHQERYIEPALETLRRHGLKGWRFMFYVLVGFNTTREYDMYRIERLHELGTYAFVMPYDKADPYQRHLARWCNNKAVFKSTPRFEDYEPWRRHCEKEAGAAR